MGIIAWVVLGAIAGWIASKIVGTDDQQGWVMNIVLGIVGALVGGFLLDLLTGDDLDFAFFDLATWIAAIVGGVIVAWAYAALTGRKTV